MVIDFRCRPDARLRRRLAAGLRTTARGIGTGGHAVAVRGPGCDDRLLGLQLGLEAALGEARVGAGGVGFWSGFVFGFGFGLVFGSAAGVTASCSAGTGAATAAAPRAAWAWWRSSDRPAAYEHRW